MSHSATRAADNQTAPPGSDRRVNFTGYRMRGGGSPWSSRTAISEETGSHADPHLLLFFLGGAQCCGSSGPAAIARLLVRSMLQF